MKLTLSLLALLSTAGSLFAGEPVVQTSSPAKVDASLYPVPKLNGSIWERERLLGDLGGSRQRLADRGIQIDLHMTNIYQGVLDGGDSQGWAQRVSDSVTSDFQRLLSRGLAKAEDSNTLLGRALNVPLPDRGNQTLGAVLQDRIDRLDLGNPLPQNLADSEYLGSWSLELRLDTTKMNLWPGGYIFMRAEQTFGRSVNARSGALLPVNVDALLPDPGYDGIMLPHLYLTQFLSEKFAFVIGKLDTSGADYNEFAHLLGDERFLGMAFAFNPVVGATAPYAPLGVGVVILPTKDLQVQLSVIDGDALPNRSGFDTVFEGKTTFAGEAKLTTNFFGKLGHQTMGGTYAQGDFAEFNQTLRAFIPTSGVTPNRSKDSWSIYYNFDQYIWNVPGETNRGVGIFARVGFADENTNPIAQFYSVGIGGKGAFPNRPYDRFGLGYYYMKTSDALPDFLNLEDEQGVEVFYNYAVTPAFMITADIQAIASAKKGIDTAIVGAIRATMRF